MPYLQMPDGRYFKFDDGQDTASVMQSAMEQFPEAYGMQKPEPKPIGGLRGELGASTERMLGDIGTGVQSLFGNANQAALDAQKREEELGKKYQTESSFEKIKKAYTEPGGGLLSAAGTAIGEIPSTVASFAPSVAEMSLPSIAGGLLGGPLGAGIGAAAGAGLTYLQSLGSGVAAQAAEQQKQGQPVDVNVGKAAAFAVPEAALNYAHLVPIGANYMGKLFGPQVERMLSRGMTAEAEEAAQAKLADAGFWKTLGQGAAQGAAIGVPTMVAQTALERAQAGQSLFDSDALAQYGSAATTGILGSPIGALGSFSERGKAREAIGAREQEQAAATRAAEEAHKQTPDYALDVFNQYNDLAQQKVDLQSQIIKLKKDSPTYEADKAANTETGKQLKDVVLKLQELAPEYNRVKKTAQVAQMNPFEYNAQQTPEATITTPVKETVQAPEQHPANVYADQQVAAAMQHPQLGLPDYAQWIMKDPELAQQYVDNQHKIPGLTTAENNVLLSGVKLQLKALEKQEQQKALAELHQRQADLQAQTTRVEPDHLASIKDAIDELEDVTNRTEPNFDYLDPMFEKAFSGTTPAVQVSPSIKQSDTAARTRANIEQILADKQKAEDSYGNALRSGDRVTAASAARDANIAVQKLDSLTTAPSEGELTAGLKNGPQTPIGDNAYASEFVTARRTQDEALGKLETALGDLREGNYFGGPNVEVKSAAGNKDSLLRKADEARAEYISSVLQEAAIHRRAEGKPGLTTDEALKAALQLHDTLTEWIDRVNAAPRRESLQEVITQPAQMRGSEVVRGAQTELRDTRNLDKRPFGAYHPAVQVLKDQLNDIRDKLGKAPSTAKRVEQTLRGQYPEYEAKKAAEAKGETATTLAGELRRKSEYVTNQIEHALRTNPPLESRELLERAKEEIADGKISRSMLDSVSDAAHRVLMGHMPDFADVQHEMAVINRLRQEGETSGKIPGQKELFTESQDRAQEEKVLGVVRSTPSKFEQAPAVKKARAAIEAVKDAAAAAEKAKDEAYAARKAKLESRVATAEDAVSAQRDDLQHAVDMARLDAKASIEAANNPRLVEAQRKLNDADIMLKSKIWESWKNGAKPALRKEIETLEEQVKKAHDGLEETLSDIKAELDSKHIVAKAHQDAAVQFEFKALEKFEKNLAELRAQKDAPRAEVVEAAKKVAQQRVQLAHADAAAKEANLAADRAKRAAELRMGRGLGLEGLRRIDGKTIKLLDEKSLETQKAIEEVRANSNRSADSLAGIKKEATSRAIGPVTREQSAAPGQFRTGSEESAAGAGRTGLSQRLSEVRGEKHRNTPIGRSELESANAIAENLREPAAQANAEAERLRKMTPAQKRKAEKERLAAEKEFAKISQDTGERVRKSRLASLYEENGGDFGEGYNASYNPASHTELSDSVKEALRDSRILDALKEVARTGSTPLVRKNAALLLKYNMRTKTGVWAKLDAPAKYFPERNGIVFHPEGMSEENLLHEANHAAAARLIDEPVENLTASQREARMGLQKLFDQVKDHPDLKGEYGVEDLHEFSSEVQSNPAFRAALDKIDVAPKVSALKQFGRWLLQLVGMGKQETNSDLASRHIENLYTPSRVYEKREPLPAASRPALSNAVALANRAIATDTPESKRVYADAFGRSGMAFMTKMVDQYHPLAVASKLMDSLAGTQMMYDLRMVGQRMNLLGQVVGHGAIDRTEHTREDGRKEWLYQAQKGANLVNVNKILSGANKLTGDSKDTAALFSLYSVAKRAANVGVERLNYDKTITKEQLANAMSEIRSVPGLEKIFSDAHAEYQEFNKNMVQSATKLGYLSKETAAKMLSNKDYVPYYRENAKGEVEMMMGDEKITRIGDIKTEPYLQQLVGGNKRILDFNTAAVRNANMLLEMGLRNQAAKSAAFNLRDIGMADVHKGDGPASPTTFRFKVDGANWYANVKDNSKGIPADLLVKGMEGIPVQTSSLMHLMGAPSRLLRQMFVANPISAGRILFKDTLSSYMTAGSNFDGIKSALRSVGDNMMERRGIAGGEVFQGLPDDMANILREVQQGKPGWETLLAKAHVLHAKADAMTRQIRYESYRKQGLSDMEASYMALESMNFTKRGISPSVHILNTLNPFINSQIQGVNTLVQALRGNMPLNEKLKIREKIFQRGMLVAGSSMLYAALMQDSPSYQGATPDQKYNNWFVPLDSFGIAEPLRVPIPFEAGMLFKAVPEALVNYLHGNDKDAAEGMRMVVQRLIPGGDTYGIPQALRPGIEAAMGKSFYTGRDIESKHEQTLQAGYRTREGTSAFAENLGKELNISPIMIDHLIGGYTGTLGLQVMQMASSLVFGKERVAAPTLAQRALIGSSFQPADAGELVNRAYEMADDVSKVHNTYKELLAKGRYDEAAAYLNKNSEEYNKGLMATQFTTGMKAYAERQKQIMQSNLTPEQKRDELRKLQAGKTTFAQSTMLQGLR